MPRPKLETPRYFLEKRGNRWHIRWSSNGVKHRKPTGTTDESEARKFLERFVAAQARPIQGEERIDRLLMHYLAFKEREYADGGQSKRLHKNLEHHLKAIFAFFGNLYVCDISAELVRNYCRHRRSQNVTDSTVRKSLGILRAALNRCKREGIYKGDIPGFDLPPSGPPRKRLLTEEQFVQFLDAPAYPHVDLFCTIMANTLKRPNAILQLQWRWGVDFDSGIIDFQPPDLRETKKRRTPSPMNEKLRAALEKAHKRRTTEYVVEFHGKNVESVKTGFKAKAASAGLPWIIPYDLRHSGASLLAMKGVPLTDIAEMMGSDEVTVAKHYRKFQPDYLRNASETLESLGGIEKGPIGPKTDN